MKRVLTIAAAATLVLCAGAVAQTNAPPKPASEMSQLKIFEGSWTCTGDQHETVFGSGHAIETKAVGKEDLGGFWIVVRYEEKKTKANDHPTTGVFAYGFDPTAKQFIANWTDSIGGYGRQTSTGWQGDKLVLLGDYVTGGQKIAARDTFVKKDAKTMTHLAELQVVKDWVPLQEETCKK